MPGHSFDGAACRRLRKERGLRPESVAHVVGRSMKSLRDYEAGDAQPPVGVVADLAELFGVELSELVTAC